MKVKDLRNRLKGLDGELDVGIDKGRYVYGLKNTKIQSGIFYLEFFDAPNFNESSVFYDKEDDEWYDTSKWSL